MKRFVLIMSFIIGLSVVANAQFMKRSPEKRAAHMTRKLQKKLNLSLEQAKEVNALLFTQATRMDSLKSVTSTDKKAKHLAARSIRLETKKRIVAVLTEEQKQRFMAWEKARKERHKGHRPRPEVQG